MRRLPLALFPLALSLVAAPAVAAEDKPTILLSPPGSGMMVGKVGGETMVLKKTPDGTVGKIGKDPVIMLDDGRGTSIGKIGKQTTICHSDPRTGLTICK